MAAFLTSCLLKEKPVQLEDESNLDGAGEPLLSNNDPLP
jgi:hypothetical protein